jgi:hypothetical protein
MRRRSIFALFLVSAACLGAQVQGAAPRNSELELYADLGLSGLMPYTWAEDGPTLSHLGMEATFGLEYRIIGRFPIRLEAGYIGVKPSVIANTGELYRGWSGGRFALLAGYEFSSIPIAICRGYRLAPAILAGGALTAAVYSNTYLAYAYPSLIVEPRLGCEFFGGSGLVLSLPLEYMYRAGCYSLSPGLGLAWYYRLGGRR